MNWTEITVSVPQEYTDSAAAIANMTVPYGIYIEDYSDLEQSAWDIAHIDLIDEELIKKNREISLIHIYFSTEQNVNEAKMYLTERLTSAGIKFNLSTDSIAESEWKDNWKKYFKCTEIGEKLVICPSWEKYEAKNNRKILNIDPGVAFGTGTHATTRLCLEMLQDYTKGGSMLDIGCGSGILAIGSALLGCEKAVGVDIDKTSVKVALENSKLNHVEDRTEFIVGDLTDKISGKFDVVCANIVADVIIHLTETVEQFLKEDGVFLCSGIIDIRAQEVEAALKKAGFSILQHRFIDNWHAFAVKK